MSTLVPLSLFLAAACGDGPTKPGAPDGAIHPRDAATPTADAGSPTADAATPTPDAGLPTADAATPTPDAGTPAPDAGTPAVLQGLVLIIEAHGSRDSHFVTALFNKPPVLGTPQASAAGCDLYASADNLRGAGYTAGTITVTGGVAPPIMIRPKDEPPYAWYEADKHGDDLFEDSAVLTVTAAGGDVPAFSGNVKAPATIAGFTAPAKISRANPPTLTWTAATAAETWIWLFIGNEETEAGEGGLLWCRTTGDPGSYAIPAAALALIPANMSRAILVLARANTADVTVGASTVKLQASQASTTIEIPLEK